MIPADRLAAIGARLAAATAGPWGHGTGYEQSDPGDYVYSEATGAIVCVDMDGPLPGVRGPDAAFIAAARQDIPDLLAELARLRAELAAEREATAARVAAARLEGAAAQDAVWKSGLDKLTRKDGRP